MTNKKHKAGERIRLITNGWYLGSQGIVLKPSQTQADGHNPYFDIDFGDEPPKGIHSIKWNWFETVPEGEASGK